MRSAKNQETSGWMPGLRERFEHRGRPDLLAQIVQCPRAPVGCGQLPGSAPFVRGRGDDAAVAYVRLQSFKGID
jgi:hypothetical protein